jgi:hypothetical protein
LTPSVLVLLSELPLLGHIYIVVEVVAWFLVLLRELPLLGHINNNVWSWWPGS